MADEEQNENVEETTAAAEAEAPEAAETAAEAPEAAADGERRRRAGQAGRRRQPEGAAPPGTRRARRQGGRLAPDAHARGAPGRARRRPQGARRRAPHGAREVAREGARPRARPRPAEPTPPREHGEGRQKERQGIVVSDKADKTITVRIDTARQHRRYHKIVRSSTTLHAHDESNDAHIGDTVIVRESRPLSRLKRWRLVEVVERAR